MTTERHLTAAELMAKLQGDVDYQRREAEKERVRQSRQQVFDRAFAPYLCQLQSLGLRGDSLGEIVKSHSPLPESAIDVLLSSLNTLSEPRLLESVIRALGVSKEPFDGRPLTRCFESTDDEALKWVIANTIAMAHPHSIDDWVSQLRKSPYWDKTLNDLGLKA